VTIGSHPVVLFPLYHPAAALYTRAMLSVLEEDFRKLPAILAQARGEAAPPAPEERAPVVETREPVEAPAAAPAAAEQLGLF
jgi:DNA polymerase